MKSCSLRSFPLPFSWKIGTKMYRSCKMYHRHVSVHFEKSVHFARSVPKSTDLTKCTDFFFLVEIVLIPIVPRTDLSYCTFAV